MKSIVEIAQTMGIPSRDLELYGQYKAKIPLDSFPSGNSQAPVVVVTGITPTPAGEGKTTIAIGLTQALGSVGKKPVLTLREPSLGPVFGIKGGGTGGGKARVMPDTDINLHFTGDAHAVGAAHNLLAAMADAAVFHKTIAGMEPDSLVWRRVTNIGDRALRRIVTGLGGASDGPLRDTGFDIDAASEIMAVLALATSYDDLRARLSNLVVGQQQNGQVITAASLGAVGPMMALLRDAIKPNLAQTLEGQPALIHAGPFGNIAHGNNSILADRLATQCGDIVVTEAGFAADLGFEKYVHIKCPAGGIPPAAAVVVATIRALRWHGGISRREIQKTNLDAVKLGVGNLEHAIGIVRRLGLPAVVAINRFPDDSPEEIEIVKLAASHAGASAAVECDVFSRGGEGGIELAQAVLEVCDNPGHLQPLYSSEDGIFDKVEALAHGIYGAQDVYWEPAARRRVDRLTEQGWAKLPICMAKTHLSISSDPTIRGVPGPYTFSIADIRLAAGAGFLYPLAGTINTMPGLPKVPNAQHIDVDIEGTITGLL